MLSLILILFVLWLGLALLMAAGTLFLQGYFNETPPDLKELLWRAPAAAGAVTAFAALWTFLAVRSPERYAPLTDFSATEVLKTYEKLWVVQEGREVEYVLGKDARGRPVYLSRLGRQRLPSRPEEIIVEEDGKKVRFLPERDAKGKFKVESSEGLRYVDDRGRVMLEGYLGQLSTSRPGAAFVYVLLNLAHAGIWFACLWPVLRFSWGQALVIAAGCWLVMTLFVMPPILTQAGDVAQQRERKSAEAAPKGRGGTREVPPLPSASHSTGVRGWPGGMVLVTWQRPRRPGTSG